MKLFAQFTQRAHDSLWGEDLGAVTMLRRRFVLALRTLYAVGRDLGEGQLTLRAMSLVYTTLLSLVPLLALSFSVLKGFGVHNQVRPALLTLLAPLGEQGVEITNNVIGFVDNIKVGVLGALGLGLLIYTVITLLQKIEHAFNFVWRVKRARPLAQRFSQYLSVLMVGPLLIFSAVGVTAAFFGSSAVQAMLAIEPLGMLVKLVAAVLPFLFVIAAFTFMYVLMPNTRVRVGSALVGATVAGVLWQALGWGFAIFIATSTKYSAIYAGFAIVIFSMIWLYLSWLIVLVGSSIACYHQYPTLLVTPRREFRLSNRVKEKIALLVATFIGRNYYTNAPAWSLEALAGRLGVPVMSVETVLTAMERAGYITETADDPPHYLPARSFETITVKELLDTLRSAEEEPGLNAATLPHDAEVEALLARLDEAVDASLRGRSLRELALASVPPVESQVAALPSRGL
ncbi:MAG: YihY/virulence factor BrkB family protein [Sulfuricaulis sp.]